MIPVKSNTIKHVRQGTFSFTTARAVIDNSLVVLANVTPVSGELEVVAIVKGDVGLADYYRRQSFCAQGWMGRTVDSIVMDLKHKAPVDFDEYNWVILEKEYAEVDSEVI